MARTMPGRSDSARHVTGIPARRAVAVTPLGRRGRCFRSRWLDFLPQWFTAASSSGWCTATSCTRRGWCRTRSSGTRSSTTRTGARCGQEPVEVFALALTSKERWRLTVILCRRRPPPEPINKLKSRSQHDRTSAIRPPEYVDLGPHRGVPLGRSQRSGREGDSGRP